MKKLVGVRRSPAPGVNELRKEAMSLLGSLIFLNAEQITEQMEQIKYLPAEGLRKLLKVLRPAFEQQHKYFQILTEHDFLFPAQLKVILYQAQISNINK